ncbi:hypothetical protein G3O08_15065 [Cryomorpha ignava]|uniref:Uncharacterized protein n=1 Tax=Cryomorpha ignava TaxID=101383 RepID=A0A7K3WUU8_9FLAO|nr:hypothetical protein [Cryomorpha ignava]NEN24821.1 hypothetical protein [Cryomorpha ignava]
MTAREVRFYTPEDKIKLESALHESLKKVILSLPFTSSYHSFKNKNVLISKLVLKNIPIVLFRLFAEEQNLKIENDNLGFWCTSPSDFTYQKTAFKLIHHCLESESRLPTDSYLSLPALIPNRFEQDVWEKRNEIKAGMDKNAFLFTFSHGKSQVISDFTIRPEILKFLQNVVEKYGHWQGAEQPYSENDFWAAFAKKGELPKISVIQFPTLIIAGVAGETAFSFFADTDAKTNHGYRLYQGKWYEIEPGGGLSFCNGLIKTHIKNATCPMEALPSFKSYIEDVG